MAVSNTTWQLFCILTVLLYEFSAFSADLAAFNSLPEAFVALLDADVALANASSALAELISSEDFADFSLALAFVSLVLEAISDFLALSA